MPYDKIAYRKRKKLEYMKKYYRRKKKSKKMKAIWAKKKAQGVPFGKWKPGNTASEIIAKGPGLRSDDSGRETVNLTHIEQMFGAGTHFRDLTPEQKREYYRNIDKRNWGKVEQEDAMFQGHPFFDQTGFQRKPETCGCGKTHNKLHINNTPVNIHAFLMGVTFKRMIEQVVEAKLAEIKK